MNRTLHILSPILEPAAALLIAMAVLVAFLTLSGFAPGSLATGLVMGSFGSKFSFGETLVTATPILLCALAAALPFWAGLMSVGAEGCLYAGAVGATIVAASLPILPSSLLIPAMMLGSILAGAAWMAMPALFRVRFQINETIVTLLANYIALLFVQYLVHGPLQDPTSFSWPQSQAFPPAAELPRWPGTRVHLGLVIAIGFAVTVQVPATWAGEKRVADGVDGC